MNVLRLNWGVFTMMGVKMKHSTVECVLDHSSPRKLGLLQILKRGSGSSIYASCQIYFNLTTKMAPRRTCQGRRRSPKQASRGEWAFPQ
ncbi:hypothetical protein NC653_030347 [Populus alba x Populus x berolinensis]|uniref:Uncharacterized protein n=1 Tax=Populus alba x Populus x berolinensis TaxID=444605 RepID=A0AAD6LWA6_9ROSI|nr:hypothetical protein NC653_030347 [Populus alba x Populus x berolinensis]